MQFDVTILGSNGAIAAYNRYPSSQVLNYNGNLYLVDCGEGALFRMNKFGIKRGKLDHIFISHMHGDHYFGLIGLLTSFNLNWREHPLHIYGPTELKEIIDIHLKYSQTHLKYEIVFHNVLPTQSQVIFEDQYLIAETIILKHRIPTTGFLFKEKQNFRKIISEKIAEHKIPYEKIPGIKQGEDFINEKGKRIPNEELTLPPASARSYAYCSDTLYSESISAQIKEVTMLYHEATFIKQHTERAKETFHSTTVEAAQMAKLAGAGKLLIGHFSARYENLQVLLNESREVFAETYLAEEGKTFAI